MHLNLVGYPYLATNEGCALSFDFNFEKDSSEQMKAAKTGSPKPFKIDLKDDRSVQSRLVITRSSGGLVANRAICGVHFRISPSGKSLYV